MSGQRQELERFAEHDDPRIRELQAKVRACKPHVPNPGDPDYLTPEQVARIKAEREADGYLD